MRRALCLALLLFLVPVAACWAKPSQRLYVLSQEAARLQVINVEADAVVASLELARGPAAFAISADGRTAYITHPEGQQISVVDLASLKLSKTIPYPGTPFGIAVDGQGRIYVSDWNRNVLTYIDGAQAGEIAVGPSPAGIALSPDGKSVLVANREGDSVSIVRTNDWMVAATVAVGHAPYALTFAPDGSRAYVVNVQGGSLSTIDVARGEAGSTIAVAAMPYGLVASADGRELLVASQQPSTLSIIDLARNEVTGTIKVGRYPEGVAVLADQRKAYVANWFSDDISVVDIPTRREIGRIKCGAGPRALALAPEVP